MPRLSPASITGRGNLRLTIGSTIVELTTTDFERHPSPPVRPYVQAAGEIDYSSFTPDEGIKHNFMDFSHGAGAFLHQDGYYAIGENIDARSLGTIGPGPREVIDKTGIAANEREIQRIRIGAVNWIITFGNTNGKVYEDSAGTWTEKSGNAGWIAGVPTCIVTKDGAIAIGMGSSQAYQYTVDGGANWITSTHAGNAKYMNRAILANNASTSAKVWYVVNPNMVYNLVSLLNGATITTASTIGDSVNDEFQDLIEDDTGVLLFFKRNYFYTIDSDGLVRNVGGQYYRKRTDIVSGGPREGNFIDPVAIEGRIYFRAENYLYEYDHGLIQRIEPGIFGSQWPRMQLPITAMAKVGNELWIAMGTSSDTTNFNVSDAPGGTGLLGNVPSNKSELWAGSYQDFGDGPQWIWHGILWIVDAYYCRYMWYDEQSGYLYAAAYTAQLINMAAKRAYVSPINALFDGSTVILATNETSYIPKIELGLFTANQPDIIKTARRQTNRTGRLVSTVPSMTVQYRIAEDDVNTGFTTLATYVTAATARTGTAYPSGTTFKGIRFRFILTGDGSANRYATLYNSQLLFLHYPPIQDIISFSFMAGTSKIEASGARSTNSMHGLRTAMMTTFKDTTEPATLLDIETGESWSVRLENGFPKEVGLGQQRQYIVVCHEVAG